MSYREQTDLPAAHQPVRCTLLRHIGRKEEEEEEEASDLNTNLQELLLKFTRAKQARHQIRGGEVCDTAVEVP